MAAGVLNLPTLVQKVRVDADTRGAEGQISSSMDRIGASMAAAGKRLTLGATVPIVGFGIAGVKAATDVEKGMREVNTLFGLSGQAAEESFGQIQSLVSGLSREVGIAQDVLTNGLYNAISAGVPRENAFEFMQVASKAAVAGVTDVNTSVDGLTSIINAFGKDASDAEAVADSMFAAVQGGKTTFEELSAAIFNIAPAAAAANVSMEEVNAAVATLTSAGTPTSVATTQIRAALVGLQRPSEEMTRIFQGLGYENAQAAIEAKGLTFALDAVSTAADGDAGKLQTLLGSVEAVAAANVLAGTGAEKMAAEMDRQANAAGSTQTAFEEMEKSNSRAMERLRVTISNLSISIGNILLPAVQSAAGFMTDLVGRFQDLSPAAQRIGVVIAGVAAAAGPLLLILSQMIRSFQTIRAVIGGASLLGMAPLVAIVAAVAGAGYLLYRNWDTVAPIFERVVATGRYLVEMFQAGASGADVFIDRSDGLAATAIRLGQGFRDLLGIGRQLFGILFQGDFEGGPLAEDSPIVEGAFRIREAAFEMADVFRRRVLPILEDVFDFVSDNARPIMLGLGAALALITAPVTTVVAALVLAYTRFETFRNVVNGVVRFIVSTVIPAVISFATQVATHVGNLIRFFQEIAPSVAEALGHVQRVITEVLSVVRTYIETWLGVAAALWRAWGDDLFAIVGAIFETIQGVVNAVLDIIANVIRTGLAIINGDWGAAWDGILGILRGVWDTIFAVLEGAIGIVRGLVGGIVSTFSEILRPLGNFLHEWIVVPFEGILDYIGRLPGQITDLASGMWDGIWQAFRSAINLIIDAWNGLDFEIPKFDPPGPGPTFGPWTIGAPDIERLATGGRSTPGLPFIAGDGGGPEIVTGEMGSAQVLNANRTERLLRSIAGGLGSTDGGDTFEITVPSYDRPTGEQLGRDIAWGVSEARGRPMEKAG